MKTIFLGLALCFLAATLSSPVAAQPAFDHLKCHRAKDIFRYSAVVDMMSVALADNYDCVIKVRAVEICTPAVKAVDETNAPGAIVSGQELENSFICYKVKCAEAAGFPALLVADQFGERNVEPAGKPFRLCAPAVFSPAP